MLLTCSRSAVAAASMFFFLCGNETENDEKTTDDGVQGVGGEREREREKGTMTNLQKK